MEDEDEVRFGGGAWSIYENEEVLSRYEVFERIGSGAYSDVYRGRDRNTGMLVALKEVHQQKSSMRELKALRILQGCANVVQLLDYFSDSPGIILVLEFLPSSLAEVIEEKSGILNGSEVKRWMKQLLNGVAECHNAGILHRDLKPSNLLVGQDGVLKVADFGTARIISSKHTNTNSIGNAVRKDVDGGRTGKALESFNSGKSTADIETWLHSGATVTATAGTSSEDYNPGGILMSRSCSKPELEETLSFGTEASPRISDCTGEDYIADEEEDESAGLTGNVGTRWYMAPELLYGATSYGFGADLWSVGCIFGELVQGMPLFPGGSDIDQLSRVVRVLGVPNEARWPGFCELPDHDKICFNEDRPPLTVSKLVFKASREAHDLLLRFLVYPPSSRITASEALRDAYFLGSDEACPADKAAVEAWISGK